MPRLVPHFTHPRQRRAEIPRSQFEGALRQLALITSALKVGLGARLDVGGEKLFVVDDRGQYVLEMTVAGAMALLVWRAHGGGTIAVPANAPHLFEQVAKRYGGRVLRTRVDPQALMAAALDEDIIMAADGTGHFIFSAFHPAMDALMALAKLVEFTARPGAGAFRLLSPQDFNTPTGRKPSSAA